MAAVTVGAASLVLVLDERLFVKLKYLIPVAAGCLVINNIFTTLGHLTNYEVYLQVSGINPPE